MAKKPVAKKKGGYKKKNWKMYKSKPQWNLTNYHNYKLPVYDDRYLAFTFNLPASTTSYSIQTAVRAYSFNSLYGTQSSALSRLYDQYRINGVKIKFMPWHTEFVEQDAQLATVDTGVMVMHACVDRDDANPPVSVQEVVARPYSKSIFLNKPWQIYFKPRIYDSDARDAVGGNLFNVKQSGKDGGNPWIDCATPDAGHCGMKFACELQFKNTSTQPVTAEVVIAARVTYYMSFKGVRTTAP